MNQAYYWLFNHKGAKIAWVSPIFRQCKKVYDEMSLAFAGHDFIKTNSSDLTIKFGGGSIQFFSAERYDNIRGFTFDYLICDEFAFMDEEAWTEVLRATVLVKGKKVLLVSTPKGKNHFYNLFQLDGINSQYKSFKMTSYDNPMIDPSEIDGARETLPEHVFKQEYLAEFIDGGSQIFNNLNVQEVHTGAKFFAGIDVGRADDYTVLSVMNESGNQVYIERWRHDTWTNIVDVLASKIKHFNCATLIEVNSIGDAIYEQLKRKVGDLVEPFVTTSKSKQDIIEGLAVANQSKEVSFCNQEWLLKEFSVFSFEYNPKTRSVKYSAPNGFHDDGVMSTAISYHSLKTMKLKGVYHLS